MTSLIGGFKSRANENQRKVEPSTHQYIGKYRQGIDTISQQSYELITTDSVEALSTQFFLNATSHLAKVGDIIRFTSGSLNREFVFVFSITANTITLSQILSDTPATSDTFEIWRPSFSAVDANGNTNVSSNGIIIPASPTSVSVGITDTSVLTLNTYKLVILENTSVNIISIGFGTAAILNSGATLLTTGSSLIIDRPFTSTVRAIASVAASSLAVQAFT